MKQVSVSQLFLTTLRNFPRKTEGKNLTMWEKILRRANIKKKWKKIKVRALIGERVWIDRTHGWVACLWMCSIDKLFLFLAANENKSEFRLFLFENMNVTQKNMATIKDLFFGFRMCPKTNTIVIVNSLQAHTWPRPFKRVSWQIWMQNAIDCLLRNCTKIAKWM